MGFCSMPETGRAGWPVGKMAELPNREGLGLSTWWYLKPSGMGGGICRRHSLCRLPDKSNSYSNMRSLSAGNYRKRKLFLFKLYNSQGALRNAMYARSTQ